MKRKILVTIALVAVILGGAYGIEELLVSFKPEPAQRDTESRAPLVSTVMLNPVDVRDILHGYGTALADRKATLAAEVSARVVERVNDLDVGDRVAAKDPLIKLDDRQYLQELHEAQSRMAAQDALLKQLSIELQNQRALLEISEADLALTREEYERVQRLLDAGNAPRSERDGARLRFQISLRAQQKINNQIALVEPRRLQIKADRSGAKAAAERALLNIERCLIVAPFDGVVELVSVDVGDRVQMGTPMVEIINLDRIEIPIELPVSTRQQAEVGARVELYVESMPRVRWDGKIGRISPSADILTRTYRVFVEVDNSLQDTPLLPGYFVRALVDGELLMRALIVPRNSVVDGRVYVANGHQAHVRKVEVLRFLEDDAVLGGEVIPGDLVITSNLDVLYDDAPVRLVDVTSSGMIENSELPGSVAMDVEGKP